MAKQTKFESLWAQYGRAGLTLCMCALFLHDIFGAHGYLAMRRTKLEIERVQGEINRLNTENAMLAEDVKALKTDPHKIEELARNGLRLAKRGDIIINIPPSQQIPQPDVKP